MIKNSPRRGNRNFFSCPPFFGILILLALLLSAPLSALQELPGDFPPCSYVLIDQASGRILMEKEGSRLMPPASLAKMMTLYLSHKDIENHIYSSGDLVTIPQEGSAAAMRPGSSLMGLKTRDTLPVVDLQRGLAVLSGNDAAWSLALWSAGSGEDFIARMNRQARELKLLSTYYTDPDGWSEKSHTTPRDQARLARAYVAAYPQALEAIHARPSLTWPPGKGTPRKNTNLLLGRLEGVDGLKTGTTPEAGFHFIATARRGETRLTAVVMGIREATSLQGYRSRARAAGILLDQGFKTWTSQSPPLPSLPEIPVHRGKPRRITPVVSGPAPVFTLTRQERASLTLTLDLPSQLEAPLHRGEAIGRMTWKAGDEVLGSRWIIIDQEISRRGLKAWLSSLQRKRK